jgi:hypothetical protein
MAAGRECLFGYSVPARSQPVAAVTDMKHANKNGNDRFSRRNKKIESDDSSANAGAYASGEM